MVSRWWNQWIWASERRRHGSAIRGVLDDWQPRSATSRTEAETAAFGRAPWVGNEELVTGALSLLWQGASVRDLARWLEGPLVVKYESGAEPGEIEELARRLVEVYEGEIFGAD